MSRQRAERKRKMRHQARVAEEEEERRKSRLQELMRRQRDALRRDTLRRDRRTALSKETRSSPQPAVDHKESKRRSWSNVRKSQHTGRTAQVRSSSSAADAGVLLASPEQVWGGRAAQVRCSTSVTVAGRLVDSQTQVWGRCLTETQRERVERVEALRGATAALDARLEEALGRVLVLSRSTAPASGPDSAQMWPGPQTPPRGSLSAETPRPPTPRRPPETLLHPTPSASLSPDTPIHQIHRGSAETPAHQTPARASLSPEPPAFSRTQQRDGPRQPVEEDPNTHMFTDALGVGVCTPAGESVGQSERPGQGRSSDSTDGTNSSNGSTSKWSELSEFYSQGALQGRLSLAQSQQFLREEELRARHSGALFRLRAEALRERTQAELALLDHKASWERRCALEPEMVSDLRQGGHQEDHPAPEHQRRDTDTRQQPASQPDPLGFLTKANLRRLLMSDDVWSFGRKRHHPAEFAPDEDAAVVPALEANGQNGQDSSPRCPRQSQAAQQGRDERQEHCGEERPGDRYGDERPGDHYGDERPGDHYGDETPGDHYGDERPGDHYGDERPGDHYGDETPGDRYGDERPGDRYGDERPGEERPGDQCEEEERPGDQCGANNTRDPTNQAHALTVEPAVKSLPPEDDTRHYRGDVSQSSDRAAVHESRARPTVSDRSPVHESRARPTVSDRAAVHESRARPTVSDRPHPVPHLPSGGTGRETSLSHRSDSKTRPGHQITERTTRDTSTITFNVLSDDANTDFADAGSDTASLNVWNNRRSQSVLNVVAASLNNNHDDRLNISNHDDRLNISTTDKEQNGETRPPPPSASTAEGGVSSGHYTGTPLPGTVTLGTVIVKADSIDSGSELQKQACDSSPSGADNMSYLSLSTESLGSSEEDNSHGDQMEPPVPGDRHASQEPSREPSCEPYREQMSFRDWEERLALPDYERETLLRLALPDYERETLLSEILSPVDEVLSYGSSELPPSARGPAVSEWGSLSLSLSLPPAPPAYEIITWTSEEDLPPPPEELDQGPGEDPSIASEHVPPLPPDSPLPAPAPAPPPVLPEDSVRADSSFFCRRVEIPDEDDGDDGDDEDLSESVPLQNLCSESEDIDQSENTTSLPVDEGNDKSDRLSSFHVGDRVLVCRSRPGVLKYKGPTAFASGTWAGVALDSPNGNHDGTFRGVKYFSCERNRGVLVRAEELSLPSGEPGSDPDTGLDEDPFSDEDPPPRGSEPRRAEQSFTRRTAEQDGGRTQNSSNANTSAPRRTCRDVKHNLQASEGSPQARCSTVRKGISLTEGGSRVGSAGNSLNNNNGSESSSSARLGSWPMDRALRETRLLDGALKETRVTDGALKETRVMDGALRETRASRTIRRHLFKESHRPKTTDLKKMEDRFGPRLLNQWHGDHPPEAQSRVPVHPHDCEIVYRLVDAAVDAALYGSGERGVGGHCKTPSHLINEESHSRYRQVFFSLTSDILHEVFSDVIATGGHCQRPDATTPTPTHCQRPDATTPTPTHCQRPDATTLTPTHCQRPDATATSLSTRDMKVTIKREVQKMLNLERSEKQIEEMLRTLCKFWYTKRDKVDYILMGELQGEERQWVDYSLDQTTVKLQLAEDIFSLLVDDTISVLRGISSSLHTQP